jgi:hypothetical protein
MNRPELAAAVVVALTATACGLRVIPSRPCLDGLPARVLVDVACRDGVCGWTCAPNRWKE